MRLAGLMSLARVKEVEQEPKPMPDKDRAIAVARQVLRYEKAGITILPSETLVLAREFMRALNMSEGG